MAAPRNFDHWVMKFHMSLGCAAPHQSQKSWEVCHWQRMWYSRKGELRALARITLTWMCTFHFSKIYTRFVYRHNHKECDVTIKSWTTLDNATKREITRHNDKKITNEKAKDKTNSANQNRQKWERTGQNEKEQNKTRKGKTEHESATRQKGETTRKKTTSQDRMKRTGHNEKEQDRTRENETKR